jgi:hypothetical protein
MTEETRKLEPTARQAARATPAEIAAPRTSTITFEPDNLASVEAAMRVLKQARADIAAAERAAGST